MFFNLKINMEYKIKFMDHSINFPKIHQDQYEIKNKILRSFKQFFQISFKDH